MAFPLLVLERTTGRPRLRLLLHARPLLATTGRPHLRLLLHARPRPRLLAAPGHLHLVLSLTLLMRLMAHPATSSCSSAATRCCLVEAGGQAQ